METTTLARRARQFCWSLQLSPSGQWWSLAGLHRRHPRTPARFPAPGRRLRLLVYPPRRQVGILCVGLARWDEVDGALLRFIITGPLHWLGIVDLARPARCSPGCLSPFRLGAAHYWQAKPPSGLPRRKRPGAGQRGRQVCASSADSTRGSLPDGALLRMGWTRAPKNTTTV